MNKLSDYKKKNLHLNNKKLSNSVMFNVILVSLISFKLVLV